MEKLTIGPNDILIVKVGSSVSDDQIKAIREQVSWQLGSDIGKRLMVVGEHVSFAVIAPTN